MAYVNRVWDALKIANLIGRQVVEKKNKEHLLFSIARDNFWVQMS
jgi:hypothetical protein